MRRRNMYYATGLPGWMRFGGGPGWGTGRGPCAQFLMTGAWPTPQAQQAWEAMQAGGPSVQPMDGIPPGPGPWGGFAPDRQQRLEFLRQQAEMVAQHLQTLNDEIVALESEQE